MDCCQTKGSPEQDYCMVLVDWYQTKFYGLVEW